MKFLCLTLILKINFVNFRFFKIMFYQQLHRQFDIFSNAKIGLIFNQHYDISRITAFTFLS